MDRDREINFLTGQVSGLMAFVSAAIKTHPNPRALMEAFQEGAERQVALTLQMPLPEIVVQGQQSMHANIEGIFREAQT